MGHPVRLAVQVVTDGNRVHMAQLRRREDDPTQRVRPRVAMQLPGNIGHGALDLDLDANRDRKGFFSRSSEHEKVNGPGRTAKWRLTPDCEATCDQDLFYAVLKLLLVAVPQAARPERLANVVDHDKFRTPLGGGP